MPIPAKPALVVMHSFLGSKMRITDWQKLLHSMFQEMLTAGMLRDRAGIHCQHDEASQVR
jgi:hypothetical protein